MFVQARSLCPSFCGCNVKGFLKRPEVSPLRFRKWREIKEWYPGAIHVVVVIPSDITSARRGLFFPLNPALPLEQRQQQSKILSPGSDQERNCLRCLQLLPEDRSREENLDPSGRKTLAPFVALSKGSSGPRPQPRTVRFAGKAGAAGQRQSSANAPGARDHGGSLPVAQVQGRAQSSPLASQRARRAVPGWQSAGRAGANSGCASAVSLLQGAWMHLLTRVAMRASRVSERRPSPGLALLPLPAVSYGGAPVPERFQTHLQDQ